MNYQIIIFFILSIIYSPSLFSADTLDILMRENQQLYLQINQLKNLNESEHQKLNEVILKQTSSDSVLMNLHDLVLSSSIQTDSLIQSYQNFVYKAELSQKKLKSQLDAVLKLLLITIVLVSFLGIYIFIHRKKAKQIFEAETEILKKQHKKIMSETDNIKPVRKDLKSLLKNQNKEVKKKKK